VIYFALWLYQLTQGHGSLILFAIGPAAYLAGLLLSGLGTVALYRSGRFLAAITVTAFFLLLGGIVGAWGILMLGST
jgi:hypothetical protein